MGLHLRHLVHGACTVSTVQAPRTRRTQCGQHRTDTGNVCAAFWKNKTNLILMHGVARCARRRTSGGQRRTGWAQYVAARCVYGAAWWLLAASTVPARCLHSACSQCERCCTVSARGVFEHVQTHWNGWVYCFAWLHWRSNWAILGKGYICLFLFYNQYIFSFKLKIWNQFLVVCIGKSIFPKFFFVVFL